MNKRIELLAPAGSEEKLNTALYFGADAVYLGGRDFGLRSTADFDDDALARAVETVHNQGKRLYVTVNIFAHNHDFIKLDEYFEMLNRLKVDGVLVSDLGILSRVRKMQPSLEVHISTQANTTNRYAAKFYEELGAKRIVLARELSLGEIKEIRDELSDETELECFVHGAMCISYSGRCLLSKFLTGRDANAGNCAQACRWQYEVNEVTRGKDKPMAIEEDERGTYIFNSKDLKTIEFIDKIADAGVTSFKIEGRMKTPYYVATVVNAYRRAIDTLEKGRYIPNPLWTQELENSPNRGFTSGFFLGGDDPASVRSDSTSQMQTHDFCGIVRRIDEQGFAYIEMRNRFFVGDTLEILSPYGELNRFFVVSKMWNEKNEEVLDAKLVQQILKITMQEELHVGDLLRKKIKK